MAQNKRSREDYCCNSVNSNEHENPPKRCCSKSDAGVLLLSDLLFADDNVDDMNAQDLQVAQHALLLDMMMTSLHQEINSCNSPIMSSSVSHEEVRYALDSPNLGDNYSSSSVVGESAPVNSSCKMDDEICRVSIDYLLHATDEELGIPPTSFSDLNDSDDESNLYSHDTENVCNYLTLEIELLSGIETVSGIAGHLVPVHAM